MRNGCAALLASALLGLPLCAQQKTGGAADETGGAGLAAQKPAAPESSAAAHAKVALSKDVFALPAVPRPKPPAAAKDTGAPGQVVPRFEVAGAYQYVEFNPGDPFASFNNHGATGSFTYNASRWLGLTGEFGGYRFDRNLFPVTGSNAGVTGGFVSYLFGPRLNLRKFDYFVPFLSLIHI